LRGGLGTLAGCDGADWGASWGGLSAPWPRYFAPSTAQMSIARHRSQRLSTMQWIPSISY